MTNEKIFFDSFCKGKGGPLWILPSQILIRVPPTKIIKKFFLLFDCNRLNSLKFDAELQSNIKKIKFREKIINENFVRGDPFKYL